MPLTLSTRTNKLVQTLQTQMLQIVASDQGLHCLPLIQQFLDTSVGSYIDLFNFWDKYGN